MFVDNDKIEELKMYMLILKAFVDGLDNKYLNFLFLEINNVINTFNEIDSAIVIEDNILNFSNEKLKYIDKYVKQWCKSIVLPFTSLLHKGFFLYK